MGNETFVKRQREAARREKRQKKAARLVERRNKRTETKSELHGGTPLASLSDIETLRNRPV
jgi:hypothetical protein